MPIIEVRGDAFVASKDYDYLCILTNGFVKSNGECVMGRGIALKSKQYYPEIPTLLGSAIRKNKNCTQHFWTTPKGTKLIAFPTKHNWWENSSPNLIVESYKQLASLLKPGETALLPRPGCGNGGLKWEDVKALLEPIAVDSIHIITF